MGIEERLSPDAWGALAALEDSVAGGLPCAVNIGRAVVRTHRVLEPEVDGPERLWWIGVDFLDGYQWEGVFREGAWRDVRADVLALFIRRGL